MPRRSPIERARDELQYWGTRSYMRSLKALVDVSERLDWVYAVANVFTYGSAIVVMIGRALFDRALHPIDTYRAAHAAAPTS